MSLQHISRTIQNNKFYRAFVRVGLIVFGAVYGLLGLFVLRLVFASDPTLTDDISFSSVLDWVNSRLFGDLWLSATTVGMSVLVVWQIIEALVGYRHLSGIRRINRRVASAGRAVIYLGIALLSALVLIGVPRSDATWSGVVAEVMERPGGGWAVLIIGVFIIGVGIGQIGRGLGTIFVDEFSTKPSQWVIRLGMIGYTMLGISLILVGILFSWSALSAQPDHAGTMNTALRLLVEQPLGQLWGIAVAGGFFAFMVFCFAWSTQPLHTTRNVK